MKKEAVLIYSGGLDSTVLLFWLIKQGFAVTALSFDYGQRHGKEIYRASKICESLGVPFMQAKVYSHDHLFKGSSQTDHTVAVPEGHYADENMKLTVVPNRNMIMLSIAAGVAGGRGIPLIVYGAHGGDHTIYPDCRPDFVRSTNEAIRQGNWDAPKVIAPFLGMDEYAITGGMMNKTDIVKIGAELEVPFALTWTCYKGLEKHCGKCGSCQERQEAFRDAGVVDPTEYEVV